RLYGLQLFSINPNLEPPPFFHFHFPMEKCPEWNLYFSRVSETRQEKYKIQAVPPWAAPGRGDLP
ncbi:MAG: hypothetical protein ACKVI4_13825, partial [Actinomycetales bacterium]